jgi:hypothetical protein
MPEQSKFTGALARLRTPREPEEQPASKAPASGRARLKKAAVAPRGRGRPPGKRSDPDFKPTTLLLREGTKRRASRKLEDDGTGQDLSELVEQLLSEWIKRR